jgi:EAL domain-containing protein (putative c-di-GMP-specific phosphodiesterase class I)/CheY-like chemotaxis protein
LSQESSLFQFKDESFNDASLYSGKPDTTSTIWKVLSVEDDPDYQQALVSSLNSIALPLHKKLEVFTATSADEAINILHDHEDMGLIFLDVVMEEDDTGLKLVNIISDEMEKESVRIVLLTGQPGFAPEKEVMTTFDIDEYWNKVDLNLTSLQSTVCGNMRTWQYICELNEAKKGLNLAVEAAQSISSRYDIESFSTAVLNEIARLIGVMDGGLLCVGVSGTKVSKGKIEVTSGCFDEFKGLTLENEKVTELLPLLEKCIHAQKHIITDKQSILYFDSRGVDAFHYVIVVQSQSGISQSSIRLLQVFCENVASGFSSLALFNKINELAYKDNDLQVPNFNWLQNVLRSLSDKQWHSTKLIMLEINHFDEMKYTFGHQFTRNALMLIFNKLTELMPENSPIALTGHKYFTVVVDETFQVNDELTNRLRNTSVTVDGVEHSILITALNMRLSGIATSSVKDIFITGESILKQASKRGDTYISYTQHEAEEINDRYRLLVELRLAIQKEALSVVLQPKTCLQTGVVVGFEALARWRRDDGSFVPPDQFISIAEASGLILKLDCLIMKQAIAAIQTLSDAGYYLPIAINASSYDLMHETYIETLYSSLEIAGIPPSMLEVEITETAAIDDLEHIKKTLARFIEQGVRISIDDFGTGYSSLSRISDSVADSIKIDQSFIAQLFEDENNQQLVKMILELGKTFNFNVIAEGIEEKEQLEWLSQQGCDFGQGYYIARPMPIDATLRWLDNRN